MNCPKCGKELLDGRLYCEHCGGEINLGPEFEAEIEQSMAESIQGLAEEVSVKTEEAAAPTKKKKRSILFFLIGSFFTIVVFVLSTLFSGGMTIWKCSTFFQEKLVDQYLEEGAYVEAISYMNSVIEKAPDNVRYQFKLSEIYLEQGKAGSALEIYKSVVEDAKYTLDEQISAVEYIIKYYAEVENYQGIAEYLETLQDENIKMAFMEYMFGTVEFNRPEGTYATMITLKLSTDGIGTIYYTTDGTEPNESSQVFQNTIFLEPGDNVISAVFINDYGVASQVVTKNYFIESRKVSPPEILTYSGSYNCPVKIQIASSPDSTVYYTDDGSIPTRNSKKYTGEFYIPTGKSVFKFVAIGYTGDSSDVITRNFQVTLDTEMTENDAKALLVKYQEDKLGVAADNAGHIAQDETHIYIYEYLYPMTVEVGVDCYYFAEVSRDITTMEQHRTNKYFGVNIRTGDIYTFNN